MRGGVVSQKISQTAVTEGPNSTDKEGLLKRQRGRGFYDNRAARRNTLARILSVTRGKR
jgi:hypothetical protein